MMEQTKIQTDINSADQRECSIALYFPNNVKDTVQVDYETKEVGLGDATLNEIFSSGGGFGLWMQYQKVYFNATKYDIHDCITER